MKLFELQYEVLLGDGKSKYRGKLLVPAKTADEAKTLFLNAVNKSAGVMTTYRNLKLMLPLGGKARVRVTSSEVFKPE